MLIFKSNGKACLKEVEGKILLEKGSLNACFNTSGEVNDAKIYLNHLCIESEIKGEITNLCYNLDKHSEKHEIKGKIRGSIKSFIQTDIGTYSFSHKQFSKYRVFEDDHQNEIKVQETDRIEVFRNEYKLVDFPKPANQKIKTLAVSLKSELDYDITIQYEDLRLEQYHGGSSLNLVWEREESLAYINKVLFMKTEAESNIDNEYHKKMISQDQKNKPLLQKVVEAPFAFFSRVLNEISDIRAMLIHSIDGLQEWLGGSFDLKNLKELMKFKMSEDQEKRYGLRKNIIVVTKKDTMISIDSKTSKVIWKKNVR